MKTVKKLLSYVTAVEYAIMVIAFVIMVICYFISVINRNFIKGSMPWTEELALYSMVYLALLGTEVGLRDGTQVAVTAVVEKFHGMARKIVDLVKQVVLEVFTFVMLSSGTSLCLRQFQSGQTTPVLKIPMGIMYFSLVLTFFLILVIQGIVLIEMVLNLRKKEGGEA